MDPDKDIEKTKKRYQKPRLRTIELAAEEVLAIGCKTVGSPAPTSIISCMTLGCAGDGS